MQIEPAQLVLPALGGDFHLVERRIEEAYYAVDLAVDIDVHRVLRQLRLILSHLSSGKQGAEKPPAVIGAALDVDFPKIARTEPAIDGHVRALIELDRRKVEADRLALAVDAQATLHGKLVSLQIDVLQIDAGIGTAGL